MQRFTESFPQDEKKPVELPDRTSTYSPLPRKDEAFSPTTGIVSPMTSDLASPDPASPGLQSLRTPDPTEKEYTPHSTEKEYFEQPALEVSDRKPVGPRNRGRRPLLFWVVGLVACLVIGLAIGLGVGLTRKSSSASPAPANPAPSAPTSIPQNFLSTVGAFNGSGIALASESFASGGHGEIVMYFQHHTGQLRSAQLESDGTWQGGDITDVVASDAKSGTPIAAVAYARNQIATWHIYYINVNNTITEVINDNTTNVWRQGPINDLHLQAMDDPNVGLEACWYGSFYSVAAYNHSPVPGQTTTTGNSSDQTVGIHLWYASNATTFNSVGWTYGDDTWTEQQTFNGYNGHAGVGCYSWGPGSDTYVFFINLHNEVNILWKELNTTLTGNSTHPVNVWTNSNISIPVVQNSSMGYTNYLYVQNPDLSISGFNVTFAAENTTIPSDPDDTFVINGAKGLSGTHLSVTSLPDSSGGNSLLAFYQTNGTDITEFVRDLDAGQWTSSSVPIPNS
ncbi:MAG: hypothetical protein ASARMPREDX12_005920 [Alectoria sarmentosa]|nr:MAG: hypothetical protein ASARMPREDX12_005920 [Alectoria sarmentosa]